MRVPIKARALFVGTSTLGSGVLAAAAWKIGSAPLATVALLTAAIIVAELFQVPGDPDSFDAVDRHAFSFSSGVHLAAILIVGPWAAAIAAASGVVCVDGVRGSPWRKVLFNACVFAIATVGAGLTFVSLGGAASAIELPAQLPAVLAAAAVYMLLNTVLVGSIVSFSASIRLWPVVSGSLRGEVATGAAEAGLGLSIAVLAGAEPWAVVALVPLAIASYTSHARLARIRRETSNALDTFANVVDERDPYTYRHSARVGDYVQDVAQKLGLAAADVATLSWAGRLHDLGKVGVDSSVLSKPSTLDEEEWAAMRRHPRLSARLVRQFRFAAEQAKAIEFHHERFDGKGYYSVDARNLPLAAHFLSVADTFDAMTSNRPYRKALSREEALGELERQSGRQFHPAVVKAFVAVQRGLDPVEALSPLELGELRRPLHRSHLDPLRRLREGRLRPEVLTIGGVVAGLLAIGVAMWPLSLVALAVAVFGLGAVFAESTRARRLAHSLRDCRPGEGALEDLLCRLSHSRSRWGALVEWRDNELDGAVAHEAGDPLARLSETALVSWLVREGDGRTELLVESGSHLGCDGVYVAVPLRHEREVRGYAVLAFARSLPRPVELALRDSGEHLSEALMPVSSLELVTPTLRAVS